MVLTAAVPPLAAVSALAVGLGVPKRVVERHHKASARATAKPPAKASTDGLGAAAKATIEAARQGHPVLSARELARTYHIGRAKAGEVRAMVLAEADGHGLPGQATTR